MKLTDLDMKYSWSFSDQKVQKDCLRVSELMNVVYPFSPNESRSFNLNTSPWKLFYAENLDCNNDDLSSFLFLYVIQSAAFEEN